MLGLGLSPCNQMGSKFFHEWFCNIEDDFSDEITLIEQHINEEKLLSALSDAWIEEVAETTPTVVMESSSPNDKPVLVVKEDCPVFIYLDDMAHEQNITEPKTLPALSSVLETTFPVITEMSSRRDELLLALTELGSCLAFIRNKPIYEVVQDDRKHLPDGLSFWNVVLSVPLMCALPHIRVIPDNSSSNNEYHWVDQKNGFGEVYRRSFENIKIKRFVCAEKKTEVQFWLNIEEILSHYKNARGIHSTNLLSVWSDFQCGFVECQQNHFTAFPGNKEKQRSTTGNMSSRLDNNELYWSNNTYEYNQHIIRKEIVRRSSSFVVSTTVVLGIFYNICSSQLSIINVLPLHKERNVSVWMPLLGLFGFMVFVCAVAVMIIVRAPFTRMQKAMLIFWGILMNLQSANSIIEVFLTLVCGLFMVWYTFVKKQPPNDVMM